jgi:hypothetical protein
MQEIINKTLKVHKIENFLAPNSILYFFIVSCA